MNIVNKLTIRHLKQNKRRTLVTIIGVIISVAMVTAVATLGVSFMNLMQKQTIADEGEWHVFYKDVNKAQLKAVQKDEASKSVVISRDLGYALLEGSQNDNKPYLFIKEYNTQGFKQFPIELREGRLPQAANEVVISEHIATNAKVVYEIGDVLTLDVGERFIAEREGQKFYQYDSLFEESDKIFESLKYKTTKSYTIVGIINRPTWEPTWAPGYTVLSYVDESLIGADDTVNATVVLKKVKSSLYSHSEDFAKENKIELESINYNNNLLRYYGVTDNDGLRSTIFSLSAIIMAVIIVGSVSLIYNAFAISVSERSRHLGMLSSVGATNRQKKNSVFFEGAVIGLISIPIGLICGFVGIGITFWFINSIIQGALGVTEKLTATVTPWSILVACAVSIMTIFISTYLPARKASRISAIDAIRQTTDIKLTSKKMKTSRVVRMLFGIEAEIGLKNLKRNKRRYQATVFSLVISIVLFLAVSFFTGNLKKSLELSLKGVNYDIQVTIGNENSEDDKQLIHSIAAIEDVTEYTVMNEMNVNAWIDETSIAAELQSMVEQDKSMLENGKFPYIIRIHALDEISLQAYAQKVGTDYEQLVDPENPAAIVIDTIPYQDQEARKYIETKAIYAEIGQSIDLYHENWETGKVTDLNKVEITALTDQFPMGVHPAGLGNLNIVTSGQVMEQLIDNQIENKIDAGFRSMLFLKSSDPMTTQQEIEQMKESNINIYNVYQSRQQEEQMIMIMSVFTYGFILLITAISVANIFNTISTSVLLRKREFAMLKSVGMTPKGFNKMINYESVFYGIKSLLYGLPISIVVMVLIHSALMNSFSYKFVLPWKSLLFVIAAVFLIVSSAMLYSSVKVKKDNIIDALKQESI
ncbi:ABC transporter permease [Paenibacillus alkaliterrae]|uniref:FtsX-like permease family protein n=1 Tax=Paenibacillus alkaliterrae TaxID=320909 RepID=UPI001F2B46EA|nr:FtsX-like permease family protein [Paenibacillus alkaliterrae]MCF2938456.1 ABC transporter permease [Paenibacillus alkaliterrae]